MSGVSAFSRFSPRLQTAIGQRLGWSSLRPVQELAGEALLDGKNAVVLAPTAGGKTEASMFPTLSQLLDDPHDGVGALYIAPIKALLNNQAERLGQYTEMVGLRRFVWHGDTSDADRKQFLRTPADVLMTTPESLEVMLASKRVDTRKLFRHLRVVVIDEVHALAGSDRGAHLMSVLERLAQCSEHDVQRIGLSATVGNPDDIAHWLQGTSKRTSTVVDPPKVKARRDIAFHYRPTLEELADEAAHQGKGHKSLFFCQSRSVTEAVAEQMRRHDVDVYVHHSAVSREERLEAEARFQSAQSDGRGACIACTSTLELGIDVGDLDFVLQAEAPDTVGAFLQRMGRTGRRAGKTANTTFFCTEAESLLQALAVVALARQGFVENVDVQTRCWPVLMHQLLAMSLASDGVTLEDAWQQLSRVADFQDIRRAEFERLVRWMLADQSLVLLSGRLLIGPKAEKHYGRRNFMELYAVFSSPQSYTVERSGGGQLGTLSQGFVDRLVENVSCFLLGGRPWLVTAVSHNDRLVKVTPAPRGRQPTWGGFIPQFLSFELCQAIRAVLVSDTMPPGVDDEAAALLTEHRSLFGALHETASVDDLDVEWTDGEVRWWTFAGGRVNSTIRYALLALHPDWKITPDNYTVRIRGDVDQPLFRETVERLRDLEFWEDPELWRLISAGFPNYRLSKFQPLMPPWVEREMLAAYLLDVAGTWRWLTGNAEGTAPTAAPLRHQLAHEGDAPTASPEPPVAVRPTSPVTWVDSAGALAALCQQLAKEPRIGLDVETTLTTRALCLVQVAWAGGVALIDAPNIEDLEPLATLLAESGVEKIIHNASFERSVLGRYGMTIEPVVDTLALSRSKRGRKIDGGHGLKAVCDRELGIVLDKAEQTSNWARRPLTPRQQAYAAVDAEVLLPLCARLQEANRLG